MITFPRFRERKNARWLWASMLTSTFHPRRLATLLRLEVYLLSDGDLHCGRVTIWRLTLSEPLLVLYNIVVSSTSKAPPTR